MFFFLKVFCFFCWGVWCGKSSSFVKSSDDFACFEKNTFFLFYPPEV